MNATFALGLLFTYAAAPLALFAALARWLGLTGKEENKAALWLVLAFGLAPALISRLLTWAMYAAPGGPKPAYVAFVVACFGALAAYGLPTFARTGQLARAAAGWIRREEASIGGAIAVAAAVLAFAVSPAGGALIERINAGWMSRWDQHVPGWAGVMPPFATWLLAGFAVAAAAACLAAPAGGADAWRRRIIAAVLAGGVAAIVVLAAMLMFGRPVYENDAIQYFKVATLFYADMSVAHHPLMPAAADGTYAATAHPLGHYGELVWSFLIAGSPAPGAGKITVFAGMLATLAALWTALRRHGGVVALAAMLLLLTTPAYLAQVLASGIDTQRLGLLLIAVLALIEVARGDTWRLAAIAGLAVGLAANGHSQNGILAPFVVATVLALAGASPWPRRIAMMAAIGAIAFAVGGERYVLNVIRFGAPFNTDLPIWHAVPSLEYRDWRMNRAPRTDLWGRLSNGPLLGFTWWWFFGLSWWTALLALVLKGRDVLRDRTLCVFAAIAIVATALLVVFFGFTRGGALLVMNYRYPMCVQPMVAALAGLLLGRLMVPHAARS